MNMTNSKKTNDPSVESDAWHRMAPRLSIVDTLLSGTEGMRAAGEVFLPRHREEEPEDWQKRLDSAVLFNQVSQTLNNLSSKPFVDEPVLIDIPDKIINIMSDIDMCGTDFKVFLRDWFKEGIAKAFSHVMVEFPRVVPRQDGMPRTLADDNADNLRPYWVRIAPENLIYARGTIIDGKTVLTHVRIKEVVSQPVGFIDEYITQIRVYEPGLVTIYQEVESAKREKYWAAVDSYSYRLDYIPLVTFYADQSGLMEGKPPMLDLAYLNVAHWQSTSEQRNALTVCRFPILGASGASEEEADDITIGPKKILYNSDPSAKYYYIEHSGAALQSGWTDIDRLQDQMASYGAEFLKKKPGRQTATARALDSAEASSDLGAMVSVFEKAVEEALEITAEWMGLPTTKADGTEVGGGSIILIKEFELAGLDDGGLEFINKARDRRDICRKAYLKEYRMRGVISQEFDADENEIELKKESQQLMDMMGTANIDITKSAVPTSKKQQQGTQNDKGTQTQ